MDCLQAKNLLSAYLDDALDWTLKQEVKDHLSSCSGCRKEFEALQTVMKDVGTFGALDAPPDFLERLHGRVDVQEKGESRIKRLMRFLFFPLTVKLPLEAISVAAVAVIVFTLFRFTGPQMQLPGASGVKAVPEQAQDRAGTQGMQPSAAGSEKPAVMPEAIQKKQETKEGLSFETGAPQAPAPAAMSRPAGIAPEPVKKTKSPRAPAEERAEESPVLTEAVKGAGYEEGWPVEISVLIRSREKAGGKAAEEKARAFMKAEAGDGTAQDAAGLQSEKEKSVTRAEEGAVLQEQNGRTSAEENAAVSRIRDAVTAVSGLEIALDHDVQTKRPSLMIARIPADKLDELCRRLGSLAEVRKPLRGASPAGQGDIMVKIRISFEALAGTQQ